MKTSLSVAQAAAASGVDVTTLRNWLAHSEFRFGSKTVTGRWRFNRADAIGIALAGELVKAGQSPKRAMTEAKSLIGRSGENALMVVASVATAVSAALVPDDEGIPAGGSLIAISLPPLRARVDSAIRANVK